MSRCPLRQSLKAPELLLLATGCLAAAILTGAVVTGHIWIAGGAPVLLLAAGSFYLWRRSRPSVNDEAAKASALRAAAKPREPQSEIELLAAEMLSQGRYSLLLRPEIIVNLTPELFEQAWNAMVENAALVPEGEVAVGFPIEGAEAEDDLLSASGRVVRVNRFYLDRYAVSNRQFREFVRAGGYEQMALWNPQIWPGILDFIDRTGHAGPRFWENGNYPAGEDELPVVGISWYEASAYARWVGKRLPTDPEWEKAASWPVHLQATTRPARRFPWGNTMDRARCNIWGSGPNRRLPVTAMPTGASVGEVHGLVGNVWEWTSGMFALGGYPNRDYQLTTPLRSIRGGAFDTYFESHATCQFQSGEDPIARKHNIGFRCAISACDLAIDHVAAMSAPSESIQIGAVAPLEQELAIP